MKPARILILLCLMILNSRLATGQEPDTLLARKYRADERGMRWYTMVILKTGPTLIEDKAIRDSLFAGHFSTIRQLAEAGELHVAGPYGKNSLTFRGLFILDTSDTTKARKMISADPTIHEGIFEAILLPWYGPAALPTYTEVQRRISPSH